MKQRGRLGSSCDYMVAVTDIGGERMIQYAMVSVYR